VAIAFISIAVAGALAYDGPFWASASRAMPVVVAGTAMGLINAVGNLGGFVAQNVVPIIRDRTGSNLAPMLFLAACLAITGGLVFVAFRVLKPKTGEPQT
ncbi:MAG TPA: hypothetical protein VN113_05690, partial [Caulobacter sp.]|nr:hypothetical protein [Caulobacter sp.]